MVAIRWVGLLLVAAVLVSDRVGAQAADPPVAAADRRASTVWGYAFAGLGAFSETFTLSTGPFPGPEMPDEIRRHTALSRHIGGGVEWQLIGGLGVGGEAGIRVIEDYPHGAFSVNGSYRFGRGRPPGRLAVPFVAAGYSQVSTRPGVNLAGGLDYWFNRGVGLRFEFRGVRIREALQGPGDFRPTLWFLDGRVGVNF